ncbi:hypothetical protein PCAR4_120039 [Paraburkholderia caribensis]|nr:hypothetical protein PCAR4_120039 [Paraburkholderia caribensis]
MNLAGSRDFPMEPIHLQGLLNNFLVEKPGLAALLTVSRQFLRGLDAFSPHLIWASFVA